MKEIIAYKVLSRIGNKLHSAMIPLEQGGINYKLKIKNYPKIKHSRLLAFASFEDAKKFMPRLTRSKKEIWTVKVTKSKKYVYRLQPYEVSTLSIIRVWSNHNHNFTTLTWPRGTIIVNYIKLIEKVEYPALTNNDNP